MTEFKATDFPFGKASRPSPKVLLWYITTVLIFFSTQELFRKEDLQDYMTTGYGKEEKNRF